MDLWTRINLFTDAIGSALDIIGLVVVIAVPAIAIGVWIGWSAAKRREPAIVTYARTITKQAKDALADYEITLNRAERMLRSSEQTENRALMNMNAAKVSREVAYEILASRPRTSLQVIEDEIAVV